MKIFKSDSIFNNLIFYHIYYSDITDSFNHVGINTTSSTTSSFLSPKNLSFYVKNGTYSDTVIAMLKYSSS
jgi:hypothetical protein